MKITTGILLLSAGLCSGAWADEPPKPSAQPVGAQTPAPSVANSDAAKPAAAAAATIPAKTDTSEVVNIADTEALTKKMRGRGYKPINRNGILVFCRSEGELGSHFERTRCNTLDELKNAERTGQEYTKHIQQQASPTPFLPAGAEH
jgi:hypothetical protein